jgi:uncharacterized protein YbbC (DUF1343 family)
MTSLPRFRPGAVRLAAALLATATVTAPANGQGATRGTTGNVVPGIEVLLQDSLHLLKGKRVGLLTNHSGRDRRGTSTVDLLFKAPGVTLTALYGPEHGIRGEARAGEKIRSTTDPATGVPVYSLYGDTEVPTPAMLKDVDVLVYDIQDVGARVYTYQWTLALMAAAAGKPLVILDRPNPIRADRFEGNILDLRFRSLVGQHAVALRYGLTVGELMRHLVATGALKAQVAVVPMRNYRRSMWFDETGIPRVNPSPNLRTLDAELLYPGTVFFEGTTATEGRGTDAPFTQIGAAWLDHAGMARTLNALRLPGVRFDTVTRTVEAGYKFGGQTIPMVRVVVTDRNAVRPVELGVRMLRAFRERHPKEFAWREPSVNAAGRIKGIDRLAGTDQLVKAVDEGTVDALLRQWDADAARFATLVKPSLLYQ